MENNIELFSRIARLETLVIERFDSHDKAADIRHSEYNLKMSAVLKHIDIINEEISKINTRCIKQMSEMGRFKEHIDKSESWKAILSDRNFRVFLALLGIGVTTILGWLTYVIKTYKNGH